MCPSISYALKPDDRNYDAMIADVKMVYRKNKLKKLNLIDNFFKHSI